MFSRLIKIVIAVLLVHAGYRVGSAYWRYYQFEDSLQELAQFGERRADKQICDQAMEAAARYQVPITAGSLIVRRGETGEFNCGTGPTGAPSPANVAAAKLYIYGAYTEQLEILPGYRYAWEFKPSVNAWIRP